MSTTSPGNGNNWQTFALGQTRSFHDIGTMSGFPPKPEIGGRFKYTPFRKGPDVWHLVK